MMDRVSIPWWQQRQGHLAAHKLEQRNRVEEILGFFKPIGDALTKKLGASKLCLGCDQERGFCGHDIQDRAAS